MIQVVDLGDDVAVLCVFYGDFSDKQLINKRQNCHNFDKKPLPIFVRFAIILRYYVDWAKL